MNMRCSKCGLELKGNEAFCPKCGSNIAQQLQNNRGVDYTRKVQSKTPTNTVNVATNAFVNNNQTNQTQREPQYQTTRGEYNYNNQQNMNNNMYNNNMYTNNNMNYGNYGQQKPNYLGTISIVVAIAALIIGFKNALIGLVLGIIAIVLASKYKKETNQKTFGKILGIISVVFSSISLLLGLLLLGGFTFLAGLLGNDATDKLTCKYKSDYVTSEATFTYKNDELNGMVVEFEIPSNVEEDDASGIDSLIMMSAFGYATTCGEYDSNNALQCKVNEYEPSGGYIIFDLDGTKSEGKEILEELTDGESLNKDKVKKQFEGMGYTCQ